jgi:hypothetical protein
MKQRPEGWTNAQWAADVQRWAVLNVDQCKRETVAKVRKALPIPGTLKEICPRGNNNIVIIIFLVHDNVYTPC